MKKRCPVMTTRSIEEYQPGPREWLWGWWSWLLGWIRWRRWLRTEKFVREKYRGIRAELAERFRACGLSERQIRLLMRECDEEMERVARATVAEWEYRRGLEQEAEEIYERVGSSSISPRCKDG